IRHLHRGQLADAHRDHAAPDRHQARAVRLPRCRGARPRHALRVVPDAAHDQRNQRLAHAPHRREALMATVTHAISARPVTSPDKAIRWTLMGISITFLTVILIVPVASVLGYAFSQGFGAYLQKLGEPDTIAAIKLTLMTAAIVVPLNTIFGVAAAWAIAKFDFRGKQVFITLIDLPVSVSP